MDTPGTSKVEEQEEKDPVVDNDSGEEEEKGPTDKKRRFSVKLTDYNVEDTTKKIRLGSEEGEETENKRSITLDMSKYSPNIQSLTDSQLIEIFNIGVAVKQSFTMTVSESSDFVKKELESQMEPIVKKMGDFQTDLRQNVSTQLNKFTDETTALKTGVLEEVAMMKNDIVGQGNQMGNFQTDMRGNVSTLLNKFTNETTAALKTGVLEEVAMMKKDLVGQVNQMGNFQTDMSRNVSTQLNKFTNETTALKTGVLEKVAMMKNDLVGEVKGLCQKVEPMRELEDRVTKAIKLSEGSVLKKLDEYKTQVNQVTQQMQKPAIKGSIGENTIMSILKKDIPHGFTLTDVSSQPCKGDIHVETPDDHHFLIEVKDYTKNVPKTEIDKFIRDVDSSHEVKVGLMFSLKTGIATKAKKSSFQIDSHNTKFLIYVPNAWERQDIVVWSVLLADELAGMNVALKDGQAEKLQKLCEKFKENVSGVKKCRENMKDLQATMKKLESNMEPMLQVIENARKEITDIMKKS